MGRELLLDRIGKSVLIIDGAMGTELIGRGAAAGCCSEYLCIESPEMVAGVHKAYIAAGAEAIITNTFGGNKYILARHGHGDKVIEINLAAAGVARQAAGESNYVLGGLGPCGDFLKPVGLVDADELKAAFAEQAKALLDGGVDGFIVETMTAVEELAIAVEAIKSVSDLPIFASMSYDPAAGGEFRTMMGVSVGRAVEGICKLGVAAIGFNCGTLDMDGYVKLAEEFSAVIGDSGVLLLTEANAGQPVLIDGKATYTLSEADYAAAGKRIYEAGARIMGGCCGTTPGHISAVAEIVSSFRPV
jgi:methionine synthase I (cobalamin-dependent)